MKRSNIIFFSLIAILYITPFVVYGVIRLMPVEQSLTGFVPLIKVLEIENQNLKADEVKIDRTPTYNAIGSIQNTDELTHLYYKGTKQYLPEVSYRDSTLVVKGAIDARNDKNLTLHVRINSINKVILNGQEIWAK